MLLQKCKFCFCQPESIRHELGSIRARKKQFLKFLKLTFLIPKRGVGNRIGKKTTKAELKFSYDSQTHESDYA